MAYYGNGGNCEGRHVGKARAVGYICEGCERQCQTGGGGTRCDRIKQ